MSRRESAQADPRAQFKLEREVLRAIFRDSHVAGFLLDESDLLAEFFSTAVHRLIYDIAHRMQLGVEFVSLETFEAVVFDVASGQVPAIERAEVAAFFAHFHAEPSAVADAA